MRVKSGKSGQRPEVAQVTRLGDYCILYLSAQPASSSGSSASRWLAPSTASTSARPCSSTHAFGIPLLSFCPSLTPPPLCFCGFCVPPEIFRKWKNTKEQVSGEGRHHTRPPLTKLQRCAPVPLPMIRPSLPQTPSLPCLRCSARLLTSPLPHLPPLPNSFCPLPMLTIPPTDAPLHHTCAAPWRSTVELCDLRVVISHGTRSPNCSVPIPCTQRGT